MKMHDEEEYVLNPDHVRAAYKGECRAYVETTYEKRRVLGIFPVSIPHDRYETRYTIHVELGGSDGSHYLSYKTREKRDVDFDALIAEVLANIKVSDDRRTT